MRQDSADLVTKEDGGILKLSEDIQTHYAHTVAGYLTLFT
jgi:hypothetical protein